MEMKGEGGGEDKREQEGAGAEVEEGKEEAQPPSGIGEGGVVGVVGAIGASGEALIIPGFRARLSPLP